MSRREFVLLTGVGGIAIALGSPFLTKLAVAASTPDAASNSAKVAKQGFEALMAGKDSILAKPLKTKVQGASGSILPDTVTAEQNRKLNELGSANK